MKANRRHRTIQSRLLNTTIHLRVFLVSLVVIFIYPSLSAKDLELFSNSKTSPALTLTAPAMITSVNRSSNTTSYTIWQNGKAYISINQKHDIKGILPAGRYLLRVNPGASVTIKLSTTIRPQNIVLWERCNKLVRPLTEGNVMVITQPTKITHVSYDGTEGLSVFAISPGSSGSRVLHYISPHKHRGGGPRVIGGTGGTTLVGQTLPAGVYRVAVGQGKADGIVKGSVTVTVR